MSKSPISKAYQSVSAFRQQLKNQRAQAAEIRKLKIQAADIDQPQARADLQQHYESRGLKVEQLYIKSCLGGEFHVSRNPPLFGKKSAKDWFNLIQSLSDQKFRPANKSVTTVIEHTLNTDANASQRAQALRDLEDSSLVESSSSVVASSTQDDRPLDDHDFRLLREERRNTLQRDFDQVNMHFQSQLRDLAIGAAISLASDRVIATHMAGVGQKFASLLTMELPTPIDADDDISDFDKLDHYLRHSDLVLQLSTSERELVQAHYLDLGETADRARLAPQPTV